MIKIAFTSSSNDRDIYMRARYVSFLVKACREHGNETEIEAAAVILPSQESQNVCGEYAAAFDGFVFTGGGDVSPALFGEKAHEKCGPVEYLRDLFEISLLHKVYELKKPVLGICRGIQIMSVAFGGSLWQDIESETGITEMHGNSRHNISVSPTLRSVFGAEMLNVNSYHHQAVRNPGDGFDIAAVSTGGIIEAITRSDRRFFTGVQWHPEMDADESSLSLMKNFLYSCV